MRASQLLRTDTSTGGKQEKEKAGRNVQEGVFLVVAVVVVVVVVAVVVYIH